MSDRQAAALRIMESFVRQRGGDPQNIRLEAGAYRWTAPDGRVACMGWKS
ncbi:hypothetical protein [Sphingobium sp.]|jgi:hypothetical protein|nr:hypothetical protein [Sphingobium sp.]